MSSFRAFVWDPILLVSQMVCLQTVFYTVEAACMLAYGTAFVYTPTIGQIFSIQTLKPMIIVQLLAALACSVALSMAVQRAKQCLDFACTLHCYHLFFVIIYNRAFPLQITWWALQIASAVVCTVVGEYLCMRLESQEIKLGDPSKYDL